MRVKQSWTQADLKTELVGGQRREDRGGEQYRGWYGGSGDGEIMVWTRMVAMGMEGNGWT